MSVKGDAQQVPSRIGDTFYRIGQEAIANAVRHGHPTALQLRLVVGRSSLMLLVRDNGSGFSVPEDAAGFGMRGMMRRAQSINADLRIHSSLGRGTSVYVRAALPQSRLTIWWRRILHIGVSKQSRHGKSL